MLLKEGVTSNDCTILILVAGDPVPEVQRQRGDFGSMIRRIASDGMAGAEGERVSFRIVDARQGVPDPREADGVLISGSPASVTEQLPWMVETQRYVASLFRLGVPTLGICFGHQIMGQALGGVVERNPRGREIGTVSLTLVGEDPVIGEAGTLLANATHVDSVVRLPAGAEVLGRTALEPHAAVRFGENMWGVQYHPELDGWSIGGYVRSREEILRGEGLDVEAALDGAQDTPGATACVPRFVELVAGRVGRQRAG